MLLVVAICIKLRVKNCLGRCNFVRKHQFLANVLVYSVGRLKGCVSTDKLRISLSKNVEL